MLIMLLNNSSSLKLNNYKTGVNPIFFSGAFL